MGQHKSGCDRCKKLAEENDTARNPPGLASVIGQNLEACAGNLLEEEYNWKRCDDEVCDEAC